MQPKIEESNAICLQVLVEFIVFKRRVFFV